MLKKSRVRLICAAGIVGVFSVSGCSSVNDVIKSGTDNYHGVPDSYKALHIDNGVAERQRQKSETIIGAKIKQMNMAGKYGYTPVFGDEAKFEMVLTSDSIIVDATWISEKGVFALGEYNAVRAKTGNRSALAWIELVASGVTEMLNELDDAGIGFKLAIEYSGSADGHPVGNALCYKGEWGYISMGGNDVMLNGAPSSFVMKPGQFVSSNAELAFLRAYSLSVWTRGMLGASASHFQIDEKFNLRTYKQRGEQFRVIQLKLEIVEEDDE